MDIEIVKAQKKHFPYIQEKIKKYLLDATEIEWRQFFVARMKNKVVAFGRIIDHGEFFEIASLGVDYYHRKKGIGKKMLKFLIQEAQKLDSCKPVYGITHLPQFVGTCDFVAVEDNYPEYFDYKRKNVCKLDASRFKIMQWRQDLA